ncbi:DegT/DnrJ/EryC1/StrS family aminotransferase [Limnofasciculus baicalensis]|uniref:DegT/DnrJ/EryC1/StrS family aminotransferase n=1 Tax=Limnofasciculus baicalensis BBK-W-15 TaxID=2699891 RepID=A0AAE3GUC1_9CYAN|nr:DegT/DnrJ/EryC1/StrS family aminotransferase [Limnofasciculus baicalensis]MCP2729918.1 DegT/DnrJ/EryC1/StrS family aminotransferase [Limnofasciculus baicalensis BBK-W-15]
MNQTASVKIPFVDLSQQHQPIQAQLDEALHSVVKRGDFVLGKALAEFEQAFAAASGAEYGIGVASGTDAIALGLRACGIGEGDEVLLPANTFIATLIGVNEARATPILVDCDPDTALIDLNAAQKAITPKTKAIVPVHLYGQMVSPSQLLEFAEANNLLIFEDAAQAHLAQREGYIAGSVGKAAAFSFYPSKNLGAFGDGGMVLMKDAEVAQKMRSLRNYGAPRKYFHADIGRNSRLDTLQAAILNVKLPHLAGWNQSRNLAASEYDKLLEPLKDMGIIPIQNQSGTGHIYHLYVIRVTDACPLDRQTIQDKLAGAGIDTGIHYPIPCHLQPAYAYLGYRVGDFPNSEILCEEIVSLPMYPGLSSEQVNFVVDTLKSLVIGC